MALIFNRDSLFYVSELSGFML